MKTKNLLRTNPGTRTPSSAIPGWLQFILLKSNIYFIRFFIVHNASIWESGILPNSPTDSLSKPHSFG